MEVRRSYKNYVIRGRSLEVRGGGFTAHTYIERYVDGAFEATPFFSRRVFQSSGIALAAALQIGQHKIDMGFDPEIIQSP
jgi:hypothetical protein